jgi:acetolactate synthase small subunit
MPSQFARETAEKIWHNAGQTVRLSNAEILDRELEQVVEVLKLAEIVAATAIFLSKKSCKPYLMADKDKITQTLRRLEKEK